MKYLGSERIVTLSYENHKTAEDYAGVMSSPISLKGTYKVIRVVTKYKTFEDSILYNQFIKEQQTWKRNGGYQCLTITGKTLFVPSNELSGNCVVIEGYYQDLKYTIGFYHLENVYVKVGDIINDEKVLGTQGNTGLVLSGKALTDKTYGTHVHVEVQNEKGEYLDPRPFVTGEKLLSYTSIKKPQETLLFTCPKTGTYFVKLQKGEQLYLVKLEDKDQ